VVGENIEEVLLKAVRDSEGEETRRKGLKWEGV